MTYIYSIYVHTYVYICIYSGILVIKRWELTMCGNIDGPWGYYAKWNKSDGERQIPYDFIHMLNIKKKSKKSKKQNKCTKQTKQNQTLRYRE